MKRWGRWLGLALVACGASEPGAPVAGRDAERRMDGVEARFEGATSANGSNAGAASGSNVAEPSPAAGSSPTAEGPGTSALPRDGARPGANGDGSGNPGAAAPPAPAAPAAPPPPAPPSAPADPLATPPARTCTLSGAAGPDTPTLWVIGDSTASVYASTLYPRMGWAQPLQDYFTPACATVSDRAISGRSSKSFFDEGAWATVRAGLRAGDYVLIQFGHNDEKSEDPTRFTEPFGSFQQYLSIYIEEARASGATPVLLTPIQRNKWNGSVLQDTHGQYPEAMRQLAAAREIALVDTSALTKSYFERLGPAATTLLFMDLAAGQFPNYPDGNDDDTHLQELGARNIAQLILADLARQDLPIGGLVQVLPVAP